MECASCIERRVVRAVSKKKALKRAPFFGAKKNYFFGFRVSFCTRQFKSSATYSVFSFGHAIS